jgi:UDP-2,3-diacylglucosamine pyrophosphatase LpxH
VIRRLTDDTLIVFLSDCHIGGDGDSDIFETPDYLAGLFDGLASYPGPVELVLAGDFFDFLRIAELPAGENRASATIARPEYAGLFDALRRFASAPGRTVLYLPGNHDAEAWWNPEIRAELERGGLVHEFALSYSAAFESDPDQIVYCEHGNEFDPTNAIQDYDDPLDTPLGHHIVTDVVRRLPRGWETEGGSLRDIGRVFPLTVIPVWLTGRLFYYLVKQVTRWLLLPLLVAYIAWEAIHYAVGERDGAVDAFVVELGYDVVLLLVVFGAFLFAAGRLAMRSTSRFEQTRDQLRGANEAAEIRERLERGEAPPLRVDEQGEIGVFVSGHTHAPSLARIAADRIVVNSGCWLRQLHPVPARLGAPPVFVSRFVQTHVRVYHARAGLEVELWEHPRPARQRLLLAERLAILGRLPEEPDDAEAPRIQARSTRRSHVGARTSE